MKAIRLEGTKVLHTVHDASILKDLKGYIEVKDIPTFELKDGFETQLHYVNGIFSFDYKPVERPAEEPIKRVPNSITMRQTKLTLLAKGLLTVVENAIAEMNDEATRIEWEYATNVERTNVLVNSLCTLLGMSDDEIDEFFIYGSTL